VLRQKVGKQLHKSDRSNPQLNLKVESIVAKATGGDTKAFFVRCDNWSKEWTEECAGGIHFFITKDEALAY
jgi:hypothetical protein